MTNGLKTPAAKKSTNLYGVNQSVSIQKLPWSRRLRGPPLDIWGAWGFCLAFIYFTREKESFIFSYELFECLTVFEWLTVCALYRHVLTVKMASVADMALNHSLTSLYFFHLRIGIFTMPCGVYLFHPFFPQKYLFQKRPGSPPHYSNGGSLPKVDVCRLKGCYALSLWIQTCCYGVFIPKEARFGCWLYFLISLL